MLHFFEILSGSRGFYRMSDIAGTPIPEFAYILKCGSKCVRHTVPRAMNSGLNRNWASAAKRSQVSARVSSWTMEIPLLIQARHDSCVNLSRNRRRSNLNAPDKLKWRNFLAYYVEVAAIVPNVCCFDSDLGSASSSTNRRRRSRASRCGRSIPIAR